MFDRLAEHIANDRPGGEGDRFSPQLRERLHGAPVIFEATDAAAWYWTDRRKLDPSKGDMGRMRPGFASTWWEFKIPDRVWVHGEHEGWVDGDGSTYAALVTCSPMTAELAGLLGHFVERDQGPHPAVVLTMMMVVQSRTGDMHELPFRTYVPLTELGEWSCWADGKRTIAVCGTDVTFDVLGDDAAESAGMLTEAFVTCIGMANARNVGVRTHTVAEKVLRKRRKRAPGAAQQYRVIHLPRRTTEQYETGQLGDGDGDELRLGSQQLWRRVRGHMKTYTEEAPLFGRYSGTWWWHDRVAAAAEAVRYQVGLPQDGEGYAETVQHTERSK